MASNRRPFPTPHRTPPIARGREPLHQRQLYVDGIGVLYEDAASEKAMSFKKALMEQHKMTDLGPAKKFLGLEINRLPDGTITLGQQDYIDTCLHASGWRTPIQPLRNCIIRLG